MSTFSLGLLISLGVVFLGFLVYCVWGRIKSDMDKREAQKLLRILSGTEALTCNPTHIFKTIYRIVDYWKFDLLEFRAVDKDGNIIRTIADVIHATVLYAESIHCEDRVRQEIRRYLRAQDRSVEEDIPLTQID